MAEHFVVHLIGSDGDQPYKVFRERSEATAFAILSVDSRQASQADIIRVAIDGGVREAAAAAQKGQGEIVDSRVSRVSDEEGKRAVLRKFNEALKRGGSAVTDLMFGLGRKGPCP